MLSLITIIFIAFYFIYRARYNNYLDKNHKIDWDKEDSMHNYMIFISVIIWLLIFTIIILNIVYISNKLTIDSKIELYEQQNEEVYSSVETIAEKYMDFESSTYKELSKDSLITLIQTYPELKSNEILNRQINILLMNNDKIIELKESRINLSVYEFILFFGGRNN